jgi:peptidoglycan/xylan/chitin deacetylase (PgdA/CDA1 family)
LAVALTFDNLDDAASRELPQLLDLLDELGLRATYFVEAIATERYPMAVREIAARGHEVGFHAWEHERWGDLDPEREAELVERGVAAFASLGIKVEGFRPPGGALTARTLSLLAEAGLTWCSPEGERAEVDAETGIAVLPFRWPLVDATYLHPPMGGLLSAADAERRLQAALDSTPEPSVLILHPFLSLHHEVREAHARLLRRLAAEREVVPGGVAAAALR